MFGAGLFTVFMSGGTLGFVEPGLGLPQGLAEGGRSKLGGIALAVGFDLNLILGGAGDVPQFLIVDEV